MKLRIRMVDGQMGDGDGTMTQTRMLIVLFIHSFSSVIQFSHSSGVGLDRKNVQH